MGPAIPDSVVKDAKVLVVGAGGIGCELLKTLVLSGFENIEVIDMDTIETSNLNRQFLFRRHDVGRSKAQVAVEVVRRMRPHARIIAHHANVKDESFGIDYFRHFALVMNGLDNLDARRHVNLMCLATGVPLVESGTAGYLGQVSVHIKDMSQCFECEPKQPPKTFPICTIRNTPDKPIHCLVWAKELLFHRLFGPCEGVTDLDEDPAKAVDADKGVVANGEGEAPSASSAGGSKELAGPAPGNEGGGDAANDASAGAPKASFFHRRPDESILDFALRVCDRVYVSDIQRVLRMDDLWKGRKRPVPLPDTAALSEIYLSMAANAKPGAHTATSSLGLSKDTHKVWTLQENFCVFMEAMRLMLETRKEDMGSLLFDKDDALAVEFVTAASNLRSIVYDIPTQSLFAAKGMAGNIIHAIATTNAIIAGLIVIEARKVLAKQLDACRLTYLRQFPSSKKLLIFETPPPPKPECYVCRTAYVGTELDTESSTLGTLVDKGLKARLGFRHPTITVGDSVMYEEGSDLEEEETERYVRMLPTVGGCCGTGRKGGWHTGGPSACVEPRSRSRSPPSGTAPCWPSMTRPASCRATWWCATGWWALTRTPTAWHCLGSRPPPVPLLARRAMIATKMTRMRFWRCRTGRSVAPRMQGQSQGSARWRRRKRHSRRLQSGRRAAPRILQLPSQMPSCLIKGNLQACHVGIADLLF
eukprot:jgi/Mesvir1/17624/Mv08850-RA.1